MTVQVYRKCCGQSAVQKPVIDDFSNPTQTAAFLAELDLADIDTESPGLRQSVVLALARSYGLTAYDAMYLELALRTGAPLATVDKQLAEAVRKAGGRVFGDAA